jgi:hypothetical protein
MPIDVAALRNEFEQLATKIGDSIDDEPWLRKVVRCFDAVGISRVDARRLAQLAVMMAVAVELNEDDLPVVPDDVIDPKILARVEQRVGVLVDNVFSGRPLLPQ